MPYVLGIDVGFDLTAAAVCRLDGPPEAVALLDPVESVLHLEPDGSVTVGSTLDPHRTARGFFDRAGDDVPVVVGGGQYLAQDLSAALVAWVLAQTPGEAPAHVVLTHPADWGPHRRDALRQALLRFGVDTVTLLSAPVVLAHGRGLVAVLDLGAETPTAAVIGPSGAILAHCAAADPVSFDHPGAARVAIGVLRRALHAAAVDPRRLDAVLLAGAPAGLGGVAGLVGALFQARVVVEERPELSTARAAALAARRVVAPEEPPTVRVIPGPRGGSGRLDGLDAPPPRPPVEVRPLDLPAPRLLPDRPVLFRALTSAAAVVGVALTLVFFRHDDAQPTSPIIPASTQPAAGVPPLVVPTTGGPHR